MNLITPGVSDAHCANENKHPVNSLRFEILKKRIEFLQAARAHRKGTSSMMVQMRVRCDDDPSLRVGFTCSKKVGNAVARNRAKRRLREAARAILPVYGQSGCDYVLIGRAEATANRPFNLLLDDLSYALKKLHAAK